MTYNPNRRTIAGEPIHRVVLTVQEFEDAWWVIDKQTGKRVASDWRMGRGFIGGGTFEMAVAQAQKLAQENDFDYEAPVLVEQNTEARRVHDNVTAGGLVLPPGVDL